MQEFMSISDRQVTGMTFRAKSEVDCPPPTGKRPAYKRAAEQVWFPAKTISVGIGHGY